jgi:hypothetical protein
LCRGGSGGEQQQRGGERKTAEWHDAETSGQERGDITMTI